MNKRLRWRFIWIASVAYLVVVSLVVLSLNLVVDRQFKRNISDTVQTIIENDGLLPPPSSFNNPRPSWYQSLMPSSRFLNRYIIVEMNGSLIEAISVHFIPNIEDRDVVDMIEAIDGHAQGMYNDLYYTFVEDNQYYIFLDIAPIKYSQSTFIINTILIALLSEILVFVVVTLVSNRVIKPIVDSHLMQQQFISDASHELKTPISIIKAHVDLQMIEHPDDSIQSIGKQIDRLNLLINKILKISTLNEHLPFESSVFNLTDMIVTIIEDFQLRALAKNVQFRTYIEHDIMMTANPEMIYELISILIDNAVKYVDSQGNIVVKLSKQQKIHLSIQNTFSHVNDIQLSSLFDRFYRVDASRHHNPGFGLGLSIAKSIVEAHRGIIQVSSANNNTILFNITL